MARKRYQPWTPSEPTPTYAEAVAAGAVKEGQEEIWYQMSPGYRREIVRSWRKHTEAK